MNLFPRWPWRRWLSLTVGASIWIAIAVVAFHPIPPIGNPFYRPVLAADELPPIKACEPWMSAGGQIIYRCVDEDVTPYAVCYAQGLMLFCLPPE